MNLENRWVRKAETIPWAEIEDKYAELFPSNTGMPAKPLRMALGSLLIQKQLGFSRIRTFSTSSDCRDTRTVHRSHRLSLLNSARG